MNPLTSAFRSTSPDLEDEGIVYHHALHKKPKGGNFGDFSGRMVLQGPSVGSGCRSLGTQGKK